MWYINVPCGTINIQVYKNLQNLFRYTKYNILQKLFTRLIINIQNYLQCYTILVFNYKIYKNNFTKVYKFIYVVKY